jgi:hypothetical protein
LSKYFAEKVSVGHERDSYTQVVKYHVRRPISATANMKKRHGGQSKKHHAKAQSSQEMQFNAVSRRGAKAQSI